MKKPSTTHRHSDDLAVAITVLLLAAAVFTKMFIL
jgi:hypothetical protein